MNSKDQKRILVTGSKGQVGVELARQLPATFPSAEILLTDRFSLDLSNLTQLKETISRFSPHIIINAGAYTAVDKAEEEEEIAYIINAEAPKILAEIAKSLGSLFIHYSTDYVFDGMKNGLYIETDMTHPLNIYGKSKLKGEQNITSIGGSFFILRTSWVYAEHGHNFLRTILRLAKEKSELSIVNDQLGSPTSASWLAEISILLSQRFFSKNPLESGIYHAVCREETNWFDYAHFILECADINNVSLNPVTSDVIPTKAKRPRNSRLSTDKIQSKLGIHPPSWKNEVERVVSFINKGKNMSTVAILMTTYNGEKFLKEQLFSIENQTFSNWHLFICDDGSSDNTLMVLKEFQERMGSSKVTIQQKSHLGCAKNFLSLVCETTGDYDFYSYADQDDIWDLNKLERAIVAMQTLDLTLPALYCTSSRLINAEGHLIGKSPICKRPPSFRNALVQNIAAGNTMVFNRPSRKLLVKLGVIDIPIHDWWTYIIVTACGGSVYYDDLPSLSYRQHANNLIGLDTSVRAFLKSIRRTWQGKFRAWNEAHISFLEDFKGLTSSESEMVLAHFKKMRQSNLYQRMRLLRKTGVFRQHPKETTSLYLACLFNKV